MKFKKWKTTDTDNIKKYLLDQQDRME